MCINMLYCGLVQYIILTSHPPIKICRIFQIAPSSDVVYLSVLTQHYCSKLHVNCMKYSRHQKDTRYVVLK